MNQSLIDDDNRINKATERILTDLLYRLEKESHTHQPDPEAHQLTREFLAIALRLNPEGLSKIGIGK